jgi:hypothetical protein
MNPGLLSRHGQAGRKRVEERFSMEMMVNSYMAVYDAVRKAKGREGGRVKRAAVSPPN